MHAENIYLHPSPACMWLDYIIAAAADGRSLHWPLSMHEHDYILHWIQLLLANAYICALYKYLYMTILIRTYFSSVMFGTKFFFVSFLIYVLFFFKKRDTYLLTVMGHSLAFVKGCTVYTIFVSIVHDFCNFYAWPCSYIPPCIRTEIGHFRFGHTSTRFFAFTEV